MNLKINNSTILGIILVSIILSISYNYFNPTGISFIAQEKALKWANDSLLFLSDNELSVNNDSSDINRNEDLTTKKDEVNLKPDTGQKNIEETTTNQNKINEETKPRGEPGLTEPAAIDLSQAYNLYKKNILFVDAREPVDYQNAHIKNAINIPFDHFDDYKHLLETIEKNQIIVAYCEGTDCDLSILLGNILFEMGYKNIYIFFGGWNEWVEAYYPIEDGDQTNK